ncbi:hypothetical protein PQQ96_35455 [Paraburkholderia sediminicola]|uniref:hypothetical protein n=1 Tax=Paraburkholderia sediminicola TaxID=458836 RepID=UPI0038BAD64E
MSTLSYERGTRFPALIDKTIGDSFDEIASKMGKHVAVVSRHEGSRYHHSPECRHGRS